MKRAKTNCSAVPVSTVRQGMMRLLFDSDQAMSSMTTMPKMGTILSMLSPRGGAAARGRASTGCRLGGVAFLVPVAL